MSDRKPSAILPVAAAVVLLIAYVGAYYAMVRPASLEAMTVEDLGSRYSSESPAVRVAFTPMHLLDRILRRRFWQEVELRQHRL